MHWRFSGKAPANNIRPMAHFHEWEVLSEADRYMGISSSGRMANQHVLMTSLISFDAAIGNSDITRSCQKLVCACNSQSCRPDVCIVIACTMTVHTIRAHEACCRCEPACSSKLPAVRDILSDLLLTSSSTVSITHVLNVVGYMDSRKYTEGCKQKTRVHQLLSCSQVGIQKFMVVMSP